MSEQEEVKLFWSRIAASIDALFKCLENAPAEQWNWKPAKSANSLYALATHVVGSTEEHLLEGVFGEEVGRDRESEFLSSGDDVSFVHAKWHRLQARLDDKFASLTDEQLAEKRHDPRLGERSAREILLIVAQHCAEHTGHAELTRDIILDK